MSTPTPAAVLAIYSDALAPGWTSASWGATVNLASVAFVHSGSYAVSFTITSAYGAFSPFRTGPTVNTSPYSNIRFWVNGQATGGQQLSFMVGIAGTQTWGPHIRINPYIAGGSVASNQWRLVDLPLNVLGATNTLINRFAIQDVSGTKQTGASVDDIELYQAASPTTTPTSIVTASSTRSVTPTTTLTSSSTPTTMPSNTATASVTDTPTMTPSSTPKATSSDTPTASATDTATATPSATPPATLTTTPTTTASATPTATTTVGTNYYVSRTGANADGRTWSSAWNELNQINWAVVRPGDTIFVDGGSSQMVYSTTLAPTTSGAPGAPITIKRSLDAGRDGQVAIFGGRNIPLPYCGQATYTYQTVGVVDRGIDIQQVSWVVVDGGKWSGISIYGHNLNGIGLDSMSSNITIRNVEIYDNGSAALVTDPLSQYYNTWASDQPGVELGGTNNTVDRTIIHDNGQDSFQSNGGIVNFTLGHSWLYNGRTHPLGPDIPWNYCRHSDGIQVYDGGVQSGLTIDSSVLGPGLMHGVILGQTGATFAQLDNVTIRDSLFINDFNANILGYAGTNPQNWVVDHVTSYVNRNTNKTILGGVNDDLHVPGSNHRITNSIFYDGRIDLTAATNVQSSGNCTFNLIFGGVNGITADPQFRALPPGNPPTIQDSINADFSLMPSSPCAGIGSTITSIAQLLTQ